MEKSALEHLQLIFRKIASHFDLDDDKDKKMPSEWLCPPEVWPVKAEDDSIAPFIRAAHRLKRSVCLCICVLVDVVVCVQHCFACLSLLQWSGGSRLPSAMQCH